MCLTTFIINVSLIRAIITFVRSKQSKQFTRGNLNISLDTLIVFVSFIELYFGELKKLFLRKFDRHFYEQIYLLKIDHLHWIPSLHSDRKTNMAFQYFY